MPFSDTFTDLMSQICTWLEVRRQTSLFRIEDTPSGKIILEIEFSTSHIAAIFQEEFAEGLPI